MVAGGQFHQDGWHVWQPHEDVRSTQFASAHESHHKQLQDSTSFGAVARLYHELAVATGHSRFGDLAYRLTEESQFVQEAFASWLPAAALGWTRSEVAAHYPQYAHYYDALEALVASISSPYLRFHAAHVLCRACMQTTAIESVLQRGLDEFRLADLRQRDLPDARAGMLRRRPPVWAAAVELLERKAESDPALHTLLAARSLTADLFHPDLSATWQQANQAMYDCVTAALSAAGATSLTLEGHLDRTPSLIAAGREIIGSLDLEAGRPRRPAEVLAIVMGNIEAETFTVADPLPARILTPQTPLASMVADLERPHLFVTVRATAGLLGNYTILAGDRPDGVVSAWARRTVVEPDGGRLVELLSLRDPPAPDALAVPLVAVIPMSLLSDPDWFAWTRGSVLRSTAMLADVALAPYLDQWTAQPQTRLRYTFLRIEAFGRVVPFLVGTVETAGSTAWPLLLRPLSHAGVRVHKAALEERDPTRRILIEDGSFLDAQRDLLELCLAHLAGEEITFGPASRGRPRTAS